jgi:hypothetical protein
MSMGDESFHAAMEAHIAHNAALDNAFEDAADFSEAEARVLANLYTALPSPKGPGKWGGKDVGEQRRREDAVKYHLSRRCNRCYKGDKIRLATPNLQGFWRTARGEMTFQVYGYCIQCKVAHVVYWVSGSFSAFPLNSLVRMPDPRVPLPTDGDNETTNQTESEIDMTKVLFQITTPTEVQSDGSLADVVQYGFKLATNSAGLFVMELKDGSIVTVPKSAVEEVLPYTVDINFIGSGSSSPKYSYLSVEGQVEVGDIVIAEGYDSMMQVVAVDTKSRRATATLKGRKLATIPVTCDL